VILNYSERLTPALAINCDLPGVTYPATGGIPGGAAIAINTDGQVVTYTYIVVSVAEYVRALLWYGRGISTWF
jgi:hypothetical protein